MTGEEIDSFLDYFKAKTALGSLHLHCYDWDVNLRKQRQFYINKQHKDRS
jgi:hypothetical protein